MAFFFSWLRRQIWRQNTMACLNDRQSSAERVAESNRELTRISRRINGAELQNTERLRPSDLQCMAELIQLYNHIEFNLRRCVEIFTHAGMIEPSNKKTPMGGLSRVALTGIRQLEDGDFWEARLTEIELHRDMRNLFAHWAARRITDEDAYLILTKNPQESNRRLGRPIDLNHSTHGIVLVKDLKWLVSHISHYDKLLAEATSEWHKRYAPTTTFTSL